VRMGRDKSGPYPRGHRFARLAAAIRHQYPEGWRAVWRFRNVSQALALSLASDG